ncbi:pyrroline-5-carboxylate reductase [Kineococcus sp. SYSU DK005]|uniref:pyrroline-5-carboxylate reductase n=1 Tax=Kineococcus sp. SYSU DK005 TaxID=3383126 RepID=UPI003D7D8389
MSAPVGAPRPHGPLALVGAGVMGQTLLGGLLRAGRSPADVLVVDRRAGRGAELRERFGVRVVDEPAAVREAATVVVAVKPQDLVDLLDSLAPHLAPGALVVSLAAGVTTAAIEARLPAGTAVVRVMPNTPSLVDEGMAGLAGGSACTDADLAEAEDLLRSCGRTVVLAEKHLDAVTALSGSGPAYVFYVVEAMVEAGVLLGLPRATATQLVVQTVVGAGAMLRETGQHPTVLREQVTSPAGTTAAALRQLDDSGVRAALVSAVEAAWARSRQLSGS